MEAAAAAREVLAARRAEVAPTGGPSVPDPLRYCIWATLALLALLLSPGVLLIWFGGLGFWRYRRAHRAGLRTTECWLREPRWAMLYLAVLALVGMVVTAWRFFPR